MPFAASCAATGTKASNLRPILRRQSADSGITSCDAWFNMEESCTVATPSFLDLTSTAQVASCLCYSGTVWQPSVFDSAFGVCLRHFSTASPAEYSYLGGAAMESFCVQAGDVRASPYLATTSLAATTDPKGLACNTLLAMGVSCASETPDFSALPLSIQLGCYCYSSSTWVPGMYDGLWLSCLSYFQTASPSWFSSVGG